jgi:hypothetical protein
MKKYRSTFIMAGIAVFLIVFYFLMTDESDTSSSSYIYRFSDGDHLQEIHITNQYGNFSFVKEDFDWFMIEPGRYRVNQNKATIMEELLLHLPVNRSLDQELEEYGFLDPSISVEVVTKKKERRTLLVGNSTPSMAQIYLKDQDSGRIYVSDIGVISQLEGSLTTFRDKEIITVDKASITHITLFEDGEKQVSVNRLRPDEWILSFPYQAPARHIELNEFLVKLQGWKVAGYPSSSLSDTEMGLDKPIWELDVMDAAGKSQRLAFGNTVEGLVYVLTDGGEDITQLYAVDVDFTHLTADDLVFVTPLLTTMDQVSRIDIAYEGRSLDFQLDTTSVPMKVMIDEQEVAYDKFLSFFVKYITLSADGYDPISKAGTEYLVLSTTFNDGSTLKLRLLHRDEETLFMEIDGKTEYFISREKVLQLMHRLESVSAAIHLCTTCT